MSGQKTVLITGASTGIGRDVARRMASRGWQVFAGVRSEGAARNVASDHDGITPVTLDVTKPETIRAAEPLIADACPTGLHGLVNNAGIGVGGPLETLELSELRRQFEVNLFGQVAVTQAFLPMLRDAPGRIVFVSSIAGKVSQPFLAPYCASKHALEAVGDALRLELRRWKIGVSLVEPGSIATPIWDKARQSAAEAKENLSERAEELYGEAMVKMRRAIEEAASRGAPVSRVSDAVEHALTASKPSTRYLVGRDAHAASLLKWVLPDRAFDWILSKA